MLMNNIHLTKHQDWYFLIDNNSTKPVILSKSAFEVLSDYKNGAERSKLDEKYGVSIVKSIFEGFESLKTNNVISENSKDLNTIRREFITGLRDKPPILKTGIFMVTQNCNLACKYCFGGDSGKYNKKGFMSKEMAENYLHYFFSVGNSRRKRRIAFFGGEPLLNIDVIVHIIELCERWEKENNGRKLTFSITTNGTLLTADIVEYLKSKNVDIMISLDGPKEINDANRIFLNGQGSFDKVMAGINLLRKYDKRFAVRATISQETDIDKLFVFFNEQNFKNIHIEAVDSHGLYNNNNFKFDDYFNKHNEIINQGCSSIIEGNKDSFEVHQMSKAHKNIKKQIASHFLFPCGAGIYTAAFSIDGNIYPCQRFVGDDAFIIGNIQQGIDIERVIDFYNNIIEASRNCDSCWAFKMCKGKCYHERLADNECFREIPGQVCDIYRSKYATALVSLSQLLNHEKVILNR